MKIVLLAASVAALSAAPATAAEPVGGFVRVRGDGLVLGDQPFRFVGANLSIMHYVERRALADSVLQASAADGIRVGRIWVLGEGPADAAPWFRDNFLVRAGPDEWMEPFFVHLDRVLVAARRHGLRLIITLSNNWGDYGGVPQYLRWLGLAEERVLAEQDTFYENPRARAFFRAHIERVVGRTNAITGRPYREDPTILAWELMNESAVKTERGAKARRDWIREMARHIRSLDPNHLITPGVSGYRTRRQRNDWLAICRLPEIDICDGHIYPEPLLEQRGMDALEPMIDDFVQLSRHVAGKPFFMGEFGMAGDPSYSWKGVSRGDWFRRIFARIFSGGAAGGLVWIYEPWTGKQREHGIFVGHEPSMPVRKALSSVALEIPSLAAAVNHAVGPARGAGEILPLLREFAGSKPRVARPEATGGIERGAASPVRIRWDPPEYQRAFWEATGFYDEGFIEHIWGADTGFFEYSYDIESTPNPPPQRIVLHARLSSEFPGTSSPPDGTSLVDVILDGRPFGSARVARDDGKGRWITLQNRNPRLVRAASAPGRHILRLEVPDVPKARGLCIYGRPTGKQPLPKNDTGPLELRFESGKAPR